MRSEQEIRDKLRELRLINLNVSRIEIQHWIEALQWALNEKRFFEK
jgi:hypothetical protein